MRSASVLVRLRATLPRRTNGTEPLTQVFAMYASAAVQYVDRYVPGVATTSTIAAGPSERSLGAQEAMHGREKQVGPFDLRVVARVRDEQ